MKSFPVLEIPVSIQYLNSADNVICYFQQLVMSGLLKKGECLPTEEAMASNLNVPIMDISRALFKLNLHGVITMDKKELYVSTLSIKLKEHIFLFLLRGRPSILNGNNYPFLYNMAANNALPGNACSVVRCVKNLMAQ